MKNIFLITVLCSILSINTFSQSAENLSNWSVELSVVYPFVRVYRINASYALLNKDKIKAEILFGPCYQNWKQKIGTAHGYSIVIGGKITFFKHFNFEYSFYPSYNEFESAIDDRIYYGFDGFQEFMLGYKINLLKNRMFINIQAVHGVPVFNTSTWPEPDDYTGFPPVFPNVSVGYRFTKK